VGETLSVQVVESTGIVGHKVELKVLGSKCPGGFLLLCKRLSFCFLLTADLSAV
jgi:hypothetical protein